MKRLLLLPLLVLFPMLLPLPAAALDADVKLDAKLSVALCHKDDGKHPNPHLIIVADNALAAHLAHGDKHLGTGLRAELEAKFSDADCAVTTTPTVPDPDPKLPVLVSVCVEADAKVVLVDKDKLDAFLKANASAYVQVNGGDPCPVPEAPHVVCPDGTGHTFKQAPGPCPEIKTPPTTSGGGTSTSTGGTAPATPGATPASTERRDTLPETGAGGLALAGIGAGLLALGLAMRAALR